MVKNLGEKILIGLLMVFMVPVAVAMCLVIAAAEAIQKRRRKT